MDAISNTEIVVSKFADYSGATKPNVDKVTFRIYQDRQRAYDDVVANNLDFIDDSNIPSDRLTATCTSTSSRTGPPSGDRPASAGSRSPPTTTTEGHAGCGRPSRWPSIGN